MIYFPNILKRKEKLKIRWLRIMSYRKAHLGKKHLLLLFIEIKFIALDYDSMKYAEQKLKISLLMLYFHILSESSELYTKTYSYLPRDHYCNHSSWVHDHVSSD